ncbi:Heme exporter protein D (CcmD) [Psychrobacter pasteurii]|uniref:Heme exporter protein D n=2 Tax=Psychrobacter pasteurii TaxID=1945520 RepID=A0A1R4ED72_9GAMM|nr:Heme exporter protein D (CcmD) [Psychrobacter pasteurii]
MGEHGPYVWSTWGITVLAILGFIFYSLSQRRRLIKELKIQHARQQQRKQRTKRN